MRYTNIELFDAGNLNTDGTVLDPDSPRAHNGRGNRLWHTDSSFNRRRASFSLQRAVVHPPERTTTDFADARTAFDQLDPALRDELLARDYVGAHSMAHSRRLGSPAYFADLDPVAAGPMARHRVAQRHEPSGRTALYVGAHLHHVEGVDPEKSAALIAALNGQVVRPGNTFSVEWRDVGDMIMWDNRCVQHRQGADSGYEGRYKRDLRRTTVHDDSPTAWGLNPVGEQVGGFSISRSWDGGKQKSEVQAK
jgi:alpha-ketoglutarate-dependent 2,4-dichlorophenoxyacetate dioxygenase